MNEEPIGLDQELIRQKVEEELRAEFTKQEHDERYEEYVTARQALTVWRVVLVVAALIIGVPVMALIAGLSVRLFYWASGL